MTTANKLQKLIERAIEDGLVVPEWVQGPAHYTQSLLQLDKAYSLIFNHDFAKALFGEEIVTDMKNKYDLLNAGVTTEDHEPTGTDYDFPVWMWHLQQAVVSDSPIAYMYEQVFGNE